MRRLALLVGLPACETFFPLTAVDEPPAPCFLDGFDGPAIDPVWIVEGNVKEEMGTLTFPVPAITTNDRPQLTSPSWNVIGASVEITSVELPMTMPAGQVSSQLRVITLPTTTPHTAQIDFDGQRLQFLVNEGTTQSTVVPFDQNHTHWRLTFDPPDVGFETSSDGASWIRDGTGIMSQGLDLAQVQLAISPVAGAASTGAARFDDLTIRAGDCAGRNLP